MNSPRISPLLRLQFLGLLMLIGLGALAARLWWVQVARGAEWTARIRGSSEATVRIPSIRGEIRDRNGTSLVQNRASYEVDFYLPEMVKGYRQRYGQPPLTEYRGQVSGMPKDLKEPDIVKIVNDGIVPRLDDLDLARDYNAGQLQKHYRTNTEVPYTYIKDIDFPTMAKFSEHDVGLPGVDIAIKPVRSYVYGALAAHLLGYVGPPDDTNKEEAGKFTFYQSDVDGKSNIEKIFDQYLRGRPGVRYLRRNAKGVIDGVLREDPPMQGANVYLTIDARIQAIAEEAIRSVARGAAVVVDPNNGDVLAMVSVPSFDPNTFIPSIKAKDWKALQKDESDPLVNRAISALPPGSTFKLITAMAGLRKKLANAHFTCSGGVSYGDHYFKCWVAEKHYTHGTLGLADAIKVSCDAFFYQYGNAAGIQSIDEVGKMLGLGDESGVKLTGEQPGILPGPEWMQVYHPQDSCALLACFAPFDHPKYVVVAMVQGGEHGGSVACPIADRILERALALDEGNFDMQVAWLAPAHKPNPFQLIKDVSFKDSGPNSGGDDEENADSSQNADVQMAAAGGSPDVEPEADAQGKVAKIGRVARAVPVPQPQRPPNFFERLFGARRQPAPQPTPAPRRAA